MPTNTAATAARQTHLQVPHSIRKTITFETAADTEIGTLPAGAVIDPALSSVLIKTAFNAATTNTIDVGTAADDNLYATALAAGSVARVPFDEFTASNVLSADTTLTVTYDQSGTAATAGEAEVVVVYHVDNDG